MIIWEEEGNNIYYISFSVAFSPFYFIIKDVKMQMGRVKTQAFHETTLKNYQFKYVFIENSGEWKNLTYVWEKYSQAVKHAKVKRKKSLSSIIHDLICNNKYFKKYYVMTLILASKIFTMQFNIFKIFPPSKLSHVTPPFAYFQNHDLYT